MFFLSKHDNLRELKKAVTWVSSIPFWYIYFNNYTLYVISVKKKINHMTLCKMRRIPGLNRAGWQWLYSQLAIHGSFSAEDWTVPTNPVIRVLAGWMGVVCGGRKANRIQTYRGFTQSKCRFGWWRGQSGPLPSLLVSLLCFSKDAYLPLGLYGCCQPTDGIPSQQTATFSHSYMSQRS